MKRFRILVVDDEERIVNFLSTKLKASGYDVLTAGDGASALEIARRDHPTLILLDMELPGTRGLDVCRTLRGDPDPALCDVPIVILTGARLKETDLVQAFSYGATDYLTKPVKPTLVRSRVRGWLLRTAEA